MYDLEGTALTLQNRRNLVAPLKPVEILRFGLAAGHAILLKNILRRFPGVSADPAEKGRVHGLGGFAVHQENRSGVRIHLLIKGRIDLGPCARAQINRLAVTQLGFGSKNASISSET